MNYKTKVTTIILIVMLISGVFVNTNIFGSSAFALENFNASIETPELKPSFSDINIDINDSLIISYEDILMDDYECNINANGITASIIDDSSYLQCEVEAIDDVEFGTLIVTAISSDGTELTSTIYTYNNGEKLFYSEFAKDQAFYEGVKEWWDNATDFVTYKYWEEKYSALMSEILSGSPNVSSSNNNTTTISGNIQWEVNKDHITLPLRNAYLEIIAKTDYEYFVLASGYTDSNGEYSLQVSNNAFSNYSDVYFRINLEGYTFKVRSGWHTFPYYFDQKLSGVINSGNSVNFSPKIIYDDSFKIYKATHVHQSTVIAERFAKEMGFETSNKIRVAYPAGFEWNNYDNALSNMGFCWGEIEDNSYCAIGWHSYSRCEMIVHEYSHYVQASLGNYGEPLREILLENPNHDGEGDYYAQKGDKSFAMHLSWTEGWGYAFSIMAQRYYANEYAPLWGDNYITDILNYSDSEYIGEFQERSVKAFLWSLVDKIAIDNHFAESDDYKLPWTPQEWWDMTTVSGTCRLPDFINLIENESYNLGVDIDYEQIKEFVAEKLTTYNIAPEFLRVYVGGTNQTLIIEWKPNGSDTSKNGEFYSNNMFIIKIFDEYGNEIFKSDTINKHVNNTGKCSYYLDVGIWNQIVNQFYCYQYIYITIESYRVDDVNDVYATSGPYYAEYFEYQLNEGHEYSYEIGNDNHKYSCQTCGFHEIEQEHYCDYRKYSSVQHYAECRYCGNRNLTNHTFEVIGKDEAKHSLRCKDCGETQNTSHNFSYTPFGSTHHYGKCIYCGYTDYMEHSIQDTTDDGIHHSKYCAICGYSTGEEQHTWIYISISALYHEGHCADCGAIKVSQQSHSWKVASNPQYVECQYCGHLKLKPTGGGGGIIPVQPFKEDDPEEETE